MSADSAALCPICRAIETIQTATIKDGCTRDMYRCLHCDTQFAIQRPADKQQAAETASGEIWH